MKIKKSLNKQYLKNEKEQDITKNDSEYEKLSQKLEDIQTEMTKISEIIYSETFVLQNWCSKFRSCRLTNLQYRFFDKQFSESKPRRVSFQISPSFLFWSRIPSSTVRNRASLARRFSAAPNTIWSDLRTFMLALWRFVHARGNFIVSCTRRFLVRPDITTMLILTLNGV